MALRVAFFGTPPFAAATLTRLIESGQDVVAVVTQPDRPRGRGHKVTAEAVKVVATMHDLRVLQPARLKDEAFLQSIRDARPDIGVVAAYGRILPQALLDIPAMGMVNVHASLLPRWRGAAPVHRAILAGDAETGVTIMRVVLALDAGPMIARVATAIDAHETSGDLEGRLAAMGAELLLMTLHRMIGGADPPVVEIAQDESLVTYAARLEKHESHIDWARPAQAIHNQIRGLQPWPLASTELHGRRLLLLRSDIDPAGTSAAQPGTIIQASKESLDVATANGVLKIREAQLEGRRPVSVADLQNGWHIASGDRFDPLPGLTP